MPLCAMHITPRRSRDSGLRLRPRLHVLVTLVALALTGCGSDGTEEDDGATVPPGTYAASCDTLATIEFQPDGVADVNRNLCEGYAPEQWDYSVDGDVLSMAPQGKLGDPDIVQETFEITAPGELVQQREESFIACGNCQKGDIWTRQ